VQKWAPRLMITGVVALVIAAVLFITSPQLRSVKVGPNSWQLLQSRSSVQDGTAACLAVVGLVALTYGGLRYIIVALKPLALPWVQFGIGIISLTIGAVIWFSNSNIPIWASTVYKMQNKPPSYYETKDIAYWGIGLAVLGLGLVVSGLVRYFHKPQGETIVQK
jgi:hypothetical protein